MSDREAFLRAIRANPDDDTVRLVFADWLDEHDDPLGEFIRVQIELEPIRDTLEDPHARHLIQREQRFLRGRGRTFGAAFGPDETLIYPEGIDFRRGLPEWICVSLDTLTSRGEQLLAAYPTVRELSVFDVEDRGSELAACPLLARFEVIEIADRLTAPDVEALAASLPLRSTRRLVLWGGWSSALAEALAPQCASDWPERIDVLWIADGLAIGTTAPECDQPEAPEETYSAAVNEAAGRELAFDVRPVRRLFPLRGWKPDAVPPDDEVELGIDSGRGLYYGRLGGRTPAILATQDGPWLLARFHENGLLVGVEERPCPFPDWSAISYEDVIERVRAEYDLRPAVIRVREFSAGERFAVYLWPGWFARQNFGLLGRPPRVAEHIWRERGGSIAQWLRQRNFVIEWGSDYWADWRGTIHSS